MIIKRQKWGCIGHTLRKDESSVARQAMQWNPLNGIARKKRRPCETWRRTVEKECKNLNKTWPDLRQLAQSGVRWSWHCWCPMSLSGSSKLRSEEEVCIYKYLWSRAINTIFVQFGFKRNIYLFVILEAIRIEITCLD